MTTGPVAGLRSDVLGRAASVWFNDCAFEHSSGGVWKKTDDNGNLIEDVVVSTGEVAVDSRECHVYSNTNKPKVWDLLLREEFYPWLLSPRKGSTSEGSDAFEGHQFPTESDAFFQRVITKQADASGHSLL